MINLVVALECEARPLIHYFKLDHNRSVSAFRLYHGDDIQLIVTGVGKVNAAAGTAFCAAFGSATATAWLNIGLCGHESRKVGSTMLALKVTDDQVGRNWYPHQAIDLPGVGGHLITYDSSVTRFPENAYCDMEASAFCATASRFSSSERVQCFKVVSDNALNPLDKKSSEFAAKLIEKHCNSVARIIRELKNLVSDAAKIEQHLIYSQAFEKRWRFTATQLIRLQDALRRIAQRDPEKRTKVGDWEHCTSSKFLLAEMEDYIGSLPVRL